MLRISSSHFALLLSLPETGMGYQNVEATTFNDKMKRGVAFNAELLVFDDEDRKLLRTLSLRKLVESAPTSAGEIRTLRVLPRLTITALSREAVVKAGPAKDAPEQKTKEGEVFKRFVAFEKDNRLRDDGSWRDGTYATTEEDAKNVKTGKEAVARYALPNSKPASYVFTGRPKKDTVIQKGTVEPAYDQPGGGVEVFLKNGTQPNTVTGPAAIPDE
jgi:hypothetical protein